MLLIWEFFAWRRALFFRKSRIQGKAPPQALPWIRWCGEYGKWKVRRAGSWRRNLGRNTGTCCATLLFAHSPFQAGRSGRLKFLRLWARFLVVLQRGPMGASTQSPSWAARGSGSPVSSVSFPAPVREYLAGACRESRKKIKAMKKQKRMAVCMACLLLGTSVSGLAPLLHWPLPCLKAKRMPTANIFFFLFKNEVLWLRWSLGLACCGNNVSVWGRVLPANRHWRQAAIMAAGKERFDRGAASRYGGSVVSTIFTYVNEVYGYGVRTQEFCRGS